MSQAQRVAIVTGASRGIGEGLVRAFRGRGVAVVATSRSITSTGDSGVVAVRGDVADPATADRVVQEAMSRFGRIDALVNNAGVFLAKPFGDYTAEDFASVTATNLAGFFHMTQRVAGPMAQQGAGHVVSITTSLTDQAVTGLPAALTNLTKGGVNSATKALAIEYAGTGIRVNSVSPGVIDTPMHDPGSHQQLAGLHPVGRMGTVDDVVDAVLYLDGAGFVTGEVLHVDGGQSAGH